MRKLSLLVLVAVGLAVALGVTRGDRLITGSSPAAAAASPIAFETPSVVDPIHTFGEPDIGVEPTGSSPRIFVSGPTGTGTQRSAWLGSVDGGHTYRVITPNLPPTAFQSIEDPP